MNRPFIEPSSDAIAVSQQLIDRIAARLAAQGAALSFYDYMQSVLYEPQLGYYVNGCRKFGAEGDYITAPELTPLFGQCLAQHIQALLSQCHKPVMMELGAGTGVLACQVLQALEQQNCLPEQYYILDVSGELKHRQQRLIQECCPHLVGVVRWLDRLPEEPFEGVIIGNEVVDAIPVHRFRWAEKQLIEMGVGYHNEHLEWRPLDHPSVSVQRAVSDIDAALRAAWPEGYTSEVRPAVSAWINSLSDCLHKGAMLWVDYGYSQGEYYHVSQGDGTLMCYYRHHGHADPLMYPGLQDITAHVDFTQLATAALDAGLDLLCYTTQTQFLLANGLEAFYQQRVMDAPDQAAATGLHMRRLIMPDQMGERFKVMVLGKNMDQSDGLSAIDIRHRL